MNPYDVDYSKWPESERITDPIDLMRLELAARLGDRMEHFSTAEVIKMTGLDKSDISRLSIANYKRFSLTRLVKLCFQMGLKVELKLSHPQG